MVYTRVVWINQLVIERPTANFYFACVPAKGEKIAILDEVGNYLIGTVIRVVYFAENKPIGTLRLAAEIQVE